MKICFIVGSFPYMDCGVGDFTSMMANALARIGNDVSVITSVKANSDVDDIEVHNIVDKFNYSSIKLIIRELKKINPDIIHIQYPSHGFYNRKITSILLPLMIKKKIKKSKLVETVHEYPKYSWKGRCIYWINYKIMDKTIFVEEYYNNLIKKDFPNMYKKLNISNIPIGSNIPQSSICELEKKKLIDKLGLSNKKIITYFGFARPNKGIDDLFKAISVIKNENIKVLYIGELRENNEYEKSLLELMEKLNIKDKFVITGYIKTNIEVADYLSISDVCVLPFKDGVKERYGSFLAACTQKIKIITTSMEEREDEEGIYYIRPNDSNGLATKIKEVIDNKNIRSNKKVNDWNDLAQLYVQAYNDINVK